MNAYKQPKLSFGIKSICSLICRIKCHILKWSLSGKARYNINKSNVHRSQLSHKPIRKQISWEPSPLGRLVERCGEKESEGERERGRDSESE